MYIEFEVEIGAKTICSSRYQYKYMYKGFIHCYFYHYCASIVFLLDSLEIRSLLMIFNIMRKQFCNEDFFFYRHAWGNAMYLKLLFILHNKKVSLIALQFYYQTFHLLQCTYCRLISTLYFSHCFEILCTQFIYIPVMITKDARNIHNHIQNRRHGAEQQFMRL